MTLAGTDPAERAAERETDYGVVPKSAKNIYLRSALSVVEWAGAHPAKRE